MIVKINEGNESRYSVITIPQVRKHVWSSHTWHYAKHSILYFITLCKWQSFLLSFYFSCFSHLSTIISIATIEASKRGEKTKSKIYQTTNDLVVACTFHHIETWVTHIKKKEHATYRIYILLLILLLGSPLLESSWGRVESGFNNMLRWEEALYPSKFYSYRNAFDVLLRK